MPIQVQGPDGQLLEFPDGTPKETMQAAMAKRYGAPRPRIPAKGKGFDPTEGMSGTEKFFAGMGKSLYDTGRGVSQLAGDVSDAVGGAFGRSNRTASGLVSGETRGDVRRREAEEQRALDAPLMDTGAGLAGNITGTVGQFLIPGGAAVRYGSMAPKAAALVRSATLPTSLRGAALQGAAIGSTQQVGEDDSRLANMVIGGGAGSAGVLIPRGLGALYRGTGSYVGKVTPRGVERRAARLILGEAENPQAVLRAQPSAIPGVQRTLAEETLDPGLARLERNARSTGRGFDTLDRTNNAARVTALRQFAGDDAQIAAAEAARDTAALPLLRKSQQVTGADTSRLVSQVERAAKLFEGRPAVQQTLRDVRDLLHRPATAAEKAASPNWPDLVPRDEVTQLYNVRKTLGDLMSGKLAGEKPHAQAATRELMVIKNGLDRVLKKASPEFGQYLDTYKAGSQGVNRLRLGSELLDSGSGSAILDPVTGQPVLTAAAFSRQANNLDRAAANATGFRKARADDILQPQDQATIKAVQDDLQRRSFAATAGSGGNSQTFERMALNDRIAGGFAARIPFIGRAAEYLGQIGQSRLQAKMAEMLANPSQARAIIAALPANDRRVIENAFVRVGASAGAMSPALAE